MPANKALQLTARRLGDAPQLNASVLRTMVGAKRPQTEKSGVKTLDQLGDLVRRRPGAPRWPYIVPAVVALLFVGHALEDAGWPGAAPYVVILALSAVGVMRPTVLAWALLVVPFLAYGVVVAMHPQNGPPGEWALFMAMGFAPVLVLWLGRSWGRRTTDAAAQEQT